ncbi:MAG: hypothetical protein ACRD1U_19115 [Vicinamibacterales bacterium]
MNRRSSACALRTLAVVSIIVMGSAAPGFAQGEEIEPRIIAQRGTTLLGMSGSLSRFFSSEELIAGTFTVQVDGHRFVFDKIALRAGLVGTGQFGGPAEDEDTAASGPGAASLEALGGALYYFTPASVWSFYGGAEYRFRLTERAASDAGAVTGLAGLQGAISSRASFFVEGGYGVRLRKGDEGELLTRIVGLAGVRFRF